MPLILLGLLLAIILLIYTTIRYIGNDRIEKHNTSSDNSDQMSEYENSCKRNKSNDTPSDNQRLLMFPQDEIEKEKQKRNIH